MMSSRLPGTGLGAGALGCGRAPGVGSLLQDLARLFFFHMLLNWAPTRLQDRAQNEYHVSFSGGFQSS